MARTKQIARKCSGGKAPRKNLLETASAKRARKQDINPDTEPEQTDDSVDTILPPESRGTRKSHKSTQLSGRKPSFYLRLAKGLTTEAIRDQEYPTEANAVITLGEIGGEYLTSLLEVASLCALHAKRHVIQSEDVKLARKLYERLREGRNVADGKSSVLQEHVE